MRKLRFLLGLLGFNTWDSWGGFGITLSWPNNQKKYELQVKIIDALTLLLADDKYLVEGPTFAAGGAQVMYVWSKDDPHVKELLEKRKTAQ